MALVGYRYRPAPAQRCHSPRPTYSPSPRKLGGGLPASGGPISSGARDEVHDSEEPDRVGPGPGNLKARAARQHGDAGIVELVGILGVDALPFGEGEALPGNGDSLRLEAAEVDFDAALDRIVERLVGEGRQIEVGVELAVHAPQKVQRELGRDAGGI